MADLRSPDRVNRMIRRTGGVVVEYGGVSGHGHEGIPPGMAFQDPDVIDGRPVVVVAAGYFPCIGVDRVHGQEETAGTDITVGDYVWRISQTIPAADDGGTVAVLLTHPD